MSDYAASAAEVKALREATGAGIMECKNALREAEGDQDAAVKLLRERGIAKTGKRADRTTKEGLIEAYVHGGRIGVLVEIGCETDFVAGTDEFKAFAHEVALQISASCRRALGQPRGRPGRGRSRASSRSTARRPPTSPRTCATRSRRASSTSGSRRSACSSSPTCATATARSTTCAPRSRRRRARTSQIKRFTRYERGA